MAWGKSSHLAGRFRAKAVSSASNRSPEAHTKREEGDRRAKIAFGQIGGPCNIPRRDDEHCRSAAMRPAHQADMVAYDIPLRLQITERAVGVERSFGPRADMRPLTIAGNSARAEAIGEEDCVSIRGQQLAPRRFTRL